MGVFICISFVLLFGDYGVFQYFVFLLRLDCIAALFVAVLFFRDCSSVFNGRVLRPSSGA